MKYVCPEEIRMRNGALKYLEELRMLARNNRKYPTEAEKIFWLELRNSHYVFLRQKPLGKYILDFYCSKLLLAIEIDGDSHDNKKYLDKERDLYFEQRGIKTVRLTNKEVLRGNGEERIKQLISKREIELFPPCQGRG